MPLQLDPLEGLGGLEGLERPVNLSDGQPLLLAIDLIDEDPAQPRKEFDPQALQELADTIAERGVRQPVSVRPHPDQPERWMLNFGARRLRASRLAGKPDIPAFVDVTVSSYDQVIENEQREGLRPLELALFIQSRLVSGDCQAEIARQLGKSRQYITYATALIDAPDWLLAAYREHRCQGLSELYDLRRLHVEHPQAVEAWLADPQPVTRERVKALRSALASVEGGSDATAKRSAATVASSVIGVSAIAAADPATVLPTASSTAPQKQRRMLTLKAKLGDETVTVVLDAVPSERGCVFVRSLPEGNLQAAPAGQLVLLGFETQ